MRQWKLLLTVVAACVLLGACKTATLNEYTVAGVRHTEPVQYNDQRYQVTFEYSDALAGFAVEVNRPERPLDASAADRDTSVAVARSAITHYACANGQRARVVEGSPSFGGGGNWSLQARCTS